MNVIHRTNSDKRMCVHRFVINLSSVLLHIVGISMYNKNIKSNKIYLRGRVKFPTDGDEILISGAREPFIGMIW